MGLILPGVVVTVIRSGKRWGTMEDQIQTAIGVVIVVLAAAFIVVNAGPALMLIGLLVACGGLVSIFTGGMLGLSLGVSGVIAGLAMIGFGRLIGFVEQQLEETKRLRRDIRSLRKAGGSPNSLEAQIAKELHADRGSRRKKKPQSAR